LEVKGPVFASKGPKTIAQGKHQRPKDERAQGVVVAETSRADAEEDQKVFRTATAKERRGFLQKKPLRRKEDFMGEGKPHRSREVKTHNLKTLPEKKIKKASLLQR